MRKISTIFIFVMCILILINIASASYIKGNIRYIGIDPNLNTKNYALNITTDEKGRLIYLENYYRTDNSYDEIRLYSSQKFYNGNITNKSFSATINRPKAKFITIIEGVFILNGKRYVITNSTGRFSVNTTNESINNSKNTTGNKTNGKNNTNNESDINESIYKMDQLNKNRAEFYKEVDKEEENISDAISETGDNLPNDNNKSISGFNISITMIVMLTIYTFKTIKSKLKIKTKNQN